MRTTVRSVRSACGFATHEGGQFVLYDFDHQLAGLEGGQHVLPQCFGFDRVGEGLGYLIVYVSFDECFPDVFQSFGDIDFCDFPLAFEYLERPFESFA